MMKFAAIDILSEKSVNVRHPYAAISILLNLSVIVTLIMMQNVVIETHI